MRARFEYASTIQLLDELRARCEVEKNPQTRITVTIENDFYTKGGDANPQKARYESDDKRFREVRESLKKLGYKDEDMEISISDLGQRLGKFDIPIFVTEYKITGEK